MGFVGMLVKWFVNVKESESGRVRSSGRWFGEENVFAPKPLIFEGILIWVWVQWS